MKKLTAIFLCFAMALSLAACGNTTSSTNESSTPESSVPPASSEASDTSSTAASQEPASQEETEVEAGNTLVVYFSATGNTEQAATYIADITGGDLFELEPADPYTDEDLNYNNEDSRVSQEYADESLRDVELVSDTVENWDSYDTVFIGYPIWWGKAPKIILTFLESLNLSGKTIVPFCTSHSSGIGSSDTDLHESAEKAAWKQGKRFNGNESTGTIKDWIESMNLNLNQNSNVGVFNLSKGENGKAPTVRLSSGYDMPIVGLGTYSLHGDVCVNSVKAALASGFRKIDTAHMYDNEEEVGQGVRESGVPREEIFVATKLYPNQFSNPEAAIEECLRKLDIGYIDLMLLHHPGTDDVKAYKAMEKYVAQGKIRSIGLSNYYIKEMTEFLPQVSTKPVKR